MSRKILDLSMLVGYDSSDDDAAVASKPSVPVDLPVVNCSPEVDLLLDSAKQQRRLDPTKVTVYTNPKAEVLHRPIAGATRTNIWSSKPVEHTMFSTPAGHHERSHISNVAFDEQFLSFQNQGWAMDPSDNPKAGVLLNPLKNANRHSLARRARPEVLPGVDVLEKRRKVAEGTLPDEYMARKVGAGPAEDRPVTIFHGRHEKDYQGRSWLAPPPNFKEVDSEAYLPKRRLYTYVGHTMAVQCVRFFPKYGHMLLSSGMDGQIKIWETDNSRKCMRTYLGHAEAVRQVNFTTDGTKFYSCGYDCQVILWDTETGQIIRRFDTEKTPFSCTVPPDPQQQNLVLAACDHKKVLQFDANSGNVVQEYGAHLESVNTVTFCDQGRKMMTTSDDKMLFVWEFGIPVVVKRIAEPYMHSMPAGTLHPGGRFVCFQSMDNQIVTYEGQGRFRFQGKKRFRGHACSGYAIQPHFSNAGDVLASGDVTGRINFWNWKTAKLLRSMPGHDSVSVCCQWRPNHDSQLVTSGWDGMLMLWE